MSGVCAVMLVKDEADVIEHTILHLRDHVNHIIVADNGSSDGTRDILEGLRGATLTVVDDPEVGYWQADKTTALALRAFHEGYDWVLPCDADEFWYSPDGRTIRDWVDGLAPDVQIVRAHLFNHIPTVLDSQDPNPFKRIGWRKREPQEIKFGKVMCRTRGDLYIEMGNHGARTDGTALEAIGLQVRHYSWRSAEQYLKKIRNGYRAYAATDMTQAVGNHWRMHGSPDDNGFDERVTDHFRNWFWSLDPDADASLVYDPVL